MRKLAIGVITAMAVSATVGGLLIHSANTSADFDLPGLNQQVQNHEARITNNENDIKALQDNTNTAPAVSHVNVPVVTAKPVETQPTPTPTPPAPTEVSRTQIQYKCGSSSYILEATITYSDGSVKVFPETMPADCHVAVPNTVNVTTP